MDRILLRHRFGRFRHCNCRHAILGLIKRRFCFYRQSRRSFICRHCQQTRAANFCLAALIAADAPLHRSRRAILHICLRLELFRLPCLHTGGFGRNAHRGDLRNRPCCHNYFGRLRIIKSGCCPHCNLL